MCDWHTENVKKIWCGDVDRICVTWEFAVLNQAVNFLSMLCLCAAILQIKKLKKLCKKLSWITTITVAC
jgi:hypothetical protein